MPQPDSWQVPEHARRDGRDCLRAQPVGPSRRLKSDCLRSRNECQRTLEEQKAIRFDLHGSTNPRIAVSDSPLRWPEALTWSHLVPGVRIETAGWDRHADSSGSTSSIRGDARAKDVGAKTIAELERSRE
jgi:hypothetical protein